MDARRDSWEVELLVELGKLLKFAGLEIGYGPTGHPVFCPGNEVVAASFQFAVSALRRGKGWPSEEIDDMLPALIHESGYGSLAYILDPPANQSKSLAAEVSDIRRETELTVKPRFDRMLIRRGNIQQVCSHERAQVAG